MYRSDGPMSPGAASSTFQVSPSLATRLLNQSSPLSAARGVGSNGHGILQNGTPESATWPVSALGATPMSALTFTSPEPALKKSAAYSPAETLLDARENTMLSQKLRTAEAALEDEKLLHEGEQQVFAERVRFIEAQNEALHDRLSGLMATLHMQQHTEFEVMATLGLEEEAFAAKGEALLQEVAQAREAEGVAESKVKNMRVAEVAADECSQARAKKASEELHELLAKRDALAASLQVSGAEQESIRLKQEVEQLRSDVHRQRTEASAWESAAEGRNAVCRDLEMKSMFETRRLEDTMAVQTTSLRAQADADKKHLESMASQAEARFRDEEKRLARELQQVEEERDVFRSSAAASAANVAALQGDVQQEKVLRAELRSELREELRRTFKNEMQSEVSDTRSKAAREAEKDLDKALRDQERRLREQFSVSESADNALRSRLRLENTEIDDNYRHEVSVAQGLMARCGDLERQLRISEGEAGALREQVGGLRETERQLRDQQNRLAQHQMNIVRCRSLESPPASPKDMVIMSPQQTYVRRPQEYDPDGGGQAAIDKVIMDTEVKAEVRRIQANMELQSREEVRRQLAAMEARVEADSRRRTGDWELQAEARAREDARNRMSLWEAEVRSDMRHRLKELEHAKAAALENERLALKDLSRSETLRREGAIAMDALLGESRSLAARSISDSRPASPPAASRPMEDCSPFLRQPLPDYTESVRSPSGSQANSRSRSRRLGGDTLSRSLSPTSRTSAAAAAAAAIAAAQHDAALAAHAVSVSEGLRIGVASSRSPASRRSMPTPLLPARALGDGSLLSAAASHVHSAAMLEGRSSAGRPPLLEPTAYSHQPSSSSLELSASASRDVGGVAAYSRWAEAHGSGFMQGRAAPPSLRGLSDSGSGDVSNGFGHHHHVLPSKVLPPSATLRDTSVGSTSASRHKSVFGVDDRTTSSQLNAVTLNASAVAPTFGGSRSFRSATPGQPGVVAALAADCSRLPGQPPTAKSARARVRLGLSSEELGKSTVQALATGDSSRPAVRATASSMTSLGRGGTSALATGRSSSWGHFTDVRISKIDSVSSNGSTNGSSSGAVKRSHSAGASSSPWKSTICPSCFNVFMEDSRFCRRCGLPRLGGSTTGR
eukprot:TRINITY_DN17360_c0_g3_i3.p1 TRINITY_DN17360_c0_g3~~TRINITY_DN17360_c0_g3_i3.p1  ORF type:complete len:1131 (-),score=298.14 TRINITY_DN17360_c0_g3_i3:361-3753(-)